MIRRSFPALKPCVLFAVILLTGCASEQPPDPCPPAGLVNGLARISAFAPEQSEDPDHRLYSAYLAGLNATCEHGRRGVSMTVEFLVLAERGPANTEGIARPHFFVAVTGPQGRIVAKETFELALPFEGSKRRVVQHEKIEPYLPGRQVRASDYRVLVGFQLSPAQKSYNRRTVQ